MKKNTQIILMIASVATLLCGCRRGENPTSSTPSSTSKDVPTTTTTIPTTVPTTQTSIPTTDPGDYYASINDSMSGTTLLNALNQLNKTKKYREVGYDEMLDKPAEGVYITDPGKSGAKYSVTAFYSGTERKGTSGMNREHVWPNSHGGNLVENDCHMIRPTITAENGSRGNSFYVEGMKTEHNGWDPAMEDFGDETFRGDSARIIFYCAIANTSLKIIDANTGGNNEMGKLSDLLKWNLKYAVATRETIRNEGALSLQGNRNPFIDHPEYACRIWGNTNSTTRSICGM